MTPNPEEIAREIVRIGESNEVATLTFSCDEDREEHIKDIAKAIQQERDRFDDEKSTWGVERKVNKEEIADLRSQLEDYRHRWLSFEPGKTIEELRLQNKELREELEACIKRRQSGNKNFTR